MKLLSLFRILNEADFLIERDILNAKELKQWAKQSSERVQSPQAKAWFSGQLFKYLINRYEEGVQPLQDIPADAPEWLTAKLQAGEPVLSIEPQDELIQQAQGVTDWLNAQSDVNLRMTWEDAVEAQKDWHEDIKRGSRVTELTPEQMEGLVTIRKYDNGYKWVDVQTEICLQHEGTIMGHCVGQGGYTQGVSDSLTKIISLRDPKGLPHATIEGTTEHPIVITKELMDRNLNQVDLFNKVEGLNLSGMTINQIKGKENKPVVLKYREYVQDFLTMFNISEFGHMGISDLENSGLFKSKLGPRNQTIYVDVNTVGETKATVKDGTSWVYISGDVVELQDHAGGIHAKWYLQDKGGRAMGNATERNAGVINSMDFGYNIDSMKFKEHVKALFNTGLKPGDGMYSGYSGLQTYGLAVGHGKQGFETVGEPQEVGSKISTISSGTVYQTREKEKAYWLMNGDKILSHFIIIDVTFNKEEPDIVATRIKFDQLFGIPAGSMSKFLEEIDELLSKPVEHIIVKGRNITVGNMTWKPGPNNNKIMEQDGVSYYDNVNEDVYHAIDSHGNLLFHMNEDTLTPMMVSDIKTAGYYAIYLIEKLEIDVGAYDNYSSLARNILDETQWFNEQHEYPYYKTKSGWFYMDDTYPIRLTVTESDEDGNETVVQNNTGTTMEEFWDLTSLRDTGLDEDFFADYFSRIYSGQHIAWDEEHHYDEEGMPTVTLYHAEGNGDWHTVLHPVSGGEAKST